MKWTQENDTAYAYIVAPLAGAWIEIISQFGKAYLAGVAPLAGAWIEIIIGPNVVKLLISRPPRGGVD